eukprot:TRINITY_DN3599_c0_g1_i2.p1 TRINITY_DN3599_c0_g1~~TRINITY_DN3599_c0_g1_i2.p1  ORF type:complete len:376 (+),score=36.67 TRINITY_DN3599_c0_g1_i2:15-1142(+)
MCFFFFFFQAEDGIRDLVRSRGLGDVYKRQQHSFVAAPIMAFADTSSLSVLAGSALEGDSRGPAHPRMNLNAASGRQLCASHSIQRPDPRMGNSSHYASAPIWSTSNGESAQPQLTPDQLLMVFQKTTSNLSVDNQVQYNKPTRSLSMSDPENMMMYPSLHWPVSKKRPRSPTSQDQEKYQQTSAFQSDQRYSTPNIQQPQPQPQQQFSAFTLDQADSSSMLPMISAGPPVFPAALCVKPGVGVNPADKRVTHVYQRSKAHKGRGEEREFLCGHCQRRKTSSSLCSDGRVRIRCECGGQHQDGVPRMHATWVTVPREEPTTINSEEKISTSSTNKKAREAGELMFIDETGKQPTIVRPPQDCYRPMHTFNIMKVH